MDSVNQEQKPHSGQITIAIICITLTMFYFILGKITGVMYNWASICAALSAIPAIVFLTRSRNANFLRIAKLFSFPVAIAILLIINLWIKAQQG